MPDAFNSAWSAIESWKRELPPSMTQSPGFSNLASARTVSVGRSPRGDHDPDGLRTLQVRDQGFERRDALRPVSRRDADGFRAAIVSRDLVTAFEQALNHEPAHLPRPTNPSCMRTTLSKGPDERERRKATTARNDLRFVRHEKSHCAAGSGMIPAP
jgi:hypothetical protein